MIAFVTLLLGLVVGVHSIEVTASGPVAKVEFLLDGTKAGEATSPPWRSAIDLGSALEPHVLVARALDAAGKSLSSTTQWLNLPRPRAEVEIALETQPDGLPVAAQLTWQSFDNGAPIASELKLDNLPLALDGHQRAALPPLDLGQIHLLSAELRFKAGLVARRDVVLGGGYGSALATELTAVPLRVQGKARRDLRSSALQGRLVSGEAPLTVAAVEEGPARVLVVSATSPARLHEQYFPDLFAARSELRFDADTRLSFVAPGARRFGGPAIAADLFDTTVDFAREDGGLFFLLAQSSPQLWQGPPRPRLNDALAVAGLLAAAENRRRAVVFLLVDGPSAERGDVSRLSAEQVRRYLAAIGVPLHVWSLAGAKGGASFTAWGQAEDISSLPKLRRAFDKLKEDLASQRIALVEGRHLLRTVRLNPGDPAVQSLDLGPTPPSRPLGGLSP